MKEIISSCLDLTKEEYQLFKEIARIRKIPKNSVLLHSGKNVNKIFFLESGAVRAYRYVNGVDYTHFFFTESWFVTDFNSFLTEKSSDLYIDASEMGGINER